MSEVETYSVLVYVRACLLYVSAENLTESRLKKMASRVVSLYGKTASSINFKSESVTLFNASGFNLHLVNIYAVSFLCVKHGKGCAVRYDSTRVTNLTAALAVKYGFIKYE